MPANPRSNLFPPPPIPGKPQCYNKVLGSGPSPHSIRAAEKSHAMSGSISASPCVSQKDTLSFKFYGSYLWLKYHLWQFPSAKLQKWYSLIAKGWYRAPKWQDRSWVESEFTWTWFSQETQAVYNVHFLGTGCSENGSRPQSVGPPSVSQIRAKSPAPASFAGWTPFLIPSRKVDGRLPPSLLDSYRLAGNLIKEYSLPGHSLLAISCSQPSIYYKGTGD